MKFRTQWFAYAVLAAALAFDVHAAAQSGVTLSGRLLSSVSGDPIPGATIRLDELRRETVSMGDGTFSFANVPPGVYHLSVHTQGYSTRRTEIAVGPDAAMPITIAVDPDVHFEDVTTVTGDARSQFDVFQPTAVLAGQELTKRLEMSIGATLESQPGVAARSFGPAPARPVIRGLDGDRVLILQDGQRVGDLSSQSGDHGVTVNPASAQRIEVVRGPATLLYGANAVGGLVNVITEDIPTKPVQGATGTLTFDAGSAASETGGAADVRVGNGSVALHAGGGGRRSGDVETPEGPLLNSQSRGGFGSVGFGWTPSKGYLGANYGYDDTKYGIPVLEDGVIQLTPRKHAFSLRGGAVALPGAFDGFRAAFAVRRYQHEELEGDEVGTAFVNNTEELDVMGSHRAVGRMKGSVGAWFLNRAFDAVGAEALSPAVSQRGFAASLYEEMTWPHVTLQFGGRIDRTHYEPTGEASRHFSSGSGSIGLLVRPAVADDRLTLAVSLARAARNPALEELYYFGPHPGNFAFEIGNPSLTPEHALGLDASLRWRTPRASGEVTYFRNDITDFIFRSPLGESDFASRVGSLRARFPGRDVGPDAIADNEFQILENINADAVLHGLEAHGDVQLTGGLVAELSLDHIRGTVKGSGAPLPRLPPLRTQIALRYQRNAFQVGGGMTAAAAQHRVFDEETPTEGYQLLRLFAAYSLQSGRVVHTVTARIDNLANALYRSHLSLIKDLAPEIGRNVKLVYTMTF